MSTLEQLFMQIFECRDRIEGQLRQQKGSYIQSLTYNLISEGGRPPEWLSTDCPNIKELNREQLISEILLPVPWTKGGHVLQSNMITETCVPDKYLNSERMVKSVRRSQHDIMAESEVAVRVEVDPFLRIQHSRSRKQDLESHPKKKAKKANHLYEPLTVEEYTCRMTRSKANLAKVGCVHMSGDLVGLHDEDGDRVSGSRVTFQKRCSLEKSIKPVKDCDSGLKMNLIASGLSETLPLIESKKLLSDGIEGSSLKQKSSYESEKRSHESYCSDTREMFEVILVKDSPEEPSRILYGGQEEERSVLHVVEDSEFSSNPNDPTSCNERFRKSPSLEKDTESSYFDGDTNLNGVPSVKEDLLFMDKITVYISPENGQLEAENFVSSGEKVKILCGGQIEDRLELHKVMESECISNHLKSNSNTDDNVSLSFHLEGLIPPPNMSPKLLSVQSTVVIENSVFWGTPSRAEICGDLPKANYFLRSSTSRDKNDGSFKLHDHTLPYYEQDEIHVGSEDVACTNAVESHNRPPKAGYFLRSSTGPINKNVGSSKTKRTSDVIASKQILGNTSRACEISWPKRNKMGVRSNNIFATSPRLKLKPSKNTGDDRNCNSQVIFQNASGAVMQDQPVSFFSEVETDILSTAYKSNLEIPCQSIAPDIMEDDPCLKGIGRAMETPLPIELIQEDPFSEENVIAIESDIHKQKTEGTSTGRQDFPHTDKKKEFESPGDSGYCEEFTEEMETNDGLKILLAHYTDDLVGFDENMPEFEGFSIDDPSINDSDLPCFTKDRLPVLDQFCGSRSILMPSSTYKIHHIPDVCQSLPNRFFEDMNLKNSFHYSDADMKQLRASEDAWLACLRCNLASEFDGSFVENSNSHIIPSLSARVPPLTPPVEKLGQRMVSRRSIATLEKIGSNPELICFRIDEDSSIEGNAQLDEFGLRGIKSSTRRKALFDVTGSYRNSPNLVSVPKTSYKENIAVSGMEDAGCLSSRSSKPGTSVKSNVRNRSQVKLGKGCKTSNIVSNISSFIPLVRQKQQEAAPAKGKKEVKVKALEAAEATKRIQEKIKNEREMRRAAARLEREKLEQEKARRLELNQKQKEEEKRKKEANIAAKKRQREEEGRREKERKRRCIEEKQKQQRTHEERLQSEREDKELRRKDVDLKETRKNDRGQTSNQPPNPGKRFGATGVEPEDAGGAGNSLEHRDASRSSYKVANKPDCLHDSNHDQFSIGKECQDPQSYEISPFIDSDEEDEEEESMRRRKKFIPLWARRESIDLFVSFQKDLDPLEIFSRKRSLNLSEVLRRKQ